jgi:2-polyprenyl-3-methyl-5-hydroxy-6-metoxy-1,4-benzoquinol methylase
MDYSTREERNLFMISRFANYFEHATSVLDIGCSEGWLARSIKPNVSYVGIDVALTVKKEDSAGSCRFIQFNLDEGRIPLPDRSFDLVVCTEVLEHLDELHFVVAEIARLCRGYVIISLPNLFNWHFRVATLAGKTTKFYGLPEEKPEDRHRWWFHPSQAQNLFRQHPGFEVVEEYYHYSKGRLATGWILRYCRIHQILPYVLSWHYWVVLKPR